MVITTPTNLFILLSQASQILSEHFMKRNFPKWSFDIVKAGNLTKTVYISSRYTSIGKNLSKIAFFEVGWFVILEKKHCSFIKLYYVSSS